MATLSPPRDIRELTSLRFFAALVVVLFHMFFEEENSVGLWSSLIADGNLGVDLFFILSGFILTHVYLPQWMAGDFRFGEFLLKRLARIYPLHLFMIGAFILAYRIADLAGISSVLAGQKWGDLPWHILLLHAWGFADMHAWNFPSWSVSAEAFAYLIFPIVLVVALKPGPLASLFLGICVFLAISLVVATQGMTLTQMTHEFGIARIAGEFFIGVALYRVFLTTSVPDRLIRPILAAILVGILVLSACQADERLIVLLLGALIFFVAHMSLQQKAGIMRHPVPVYLGEVSYATYMVHMILLMSVDAIGPKLGLSSALNTLLAFILIYVGSVVVHHLVELPGRQIVRRFSRDAAVSTQ